MFSVEERMNLMSNPIVNTWENSHNHFQGHQYQTLNAHEKPSCKCYIIPPHLQQNIQTFREQDEEFRHLRRATYATPHTLTWHWPHEHHSTEEEEGQSTEVVQKFDPTPFMKKIVRMVYDSQHRERLPGKFVISSQGVPGVSGYKEKGSTHDATVNQALDNALNVFLFYLKQYEYNSIDGKGMPIVSCVHYGKNYENAFWDGTEMVYGDGSDLFRAFVYFLDVVGHELSHGVTGNRLIYEGEAGALNEHFSDVMGYLVYMYTHRLDVNHANWLLADGILHVGNKSYPLRSFKAPGTAYDIPELGKDPQPAKYGDLYKGSEDNGGVHINSGIPNHAFYLFATEVGGNAWDKAGLIWFTTMMTPHAFKSNASMKDFANATIKVADKLFPQDQVVQTAIRRAWKEVEVLL